jgi:hypothetical protein
MIYISPGFTESDLYMILKIADEIAIKEKISTIILDDKINFKIDTLSLKTKLKVESNQKKLSIKSLFKNFFVLIFYSFKLVNFPIVSSNSMINNFFHSVWDVTRIRNRNISNNFLFFLYFFRNLISCILYKSKIENYISAKKFEYSFFSHIVYYQRISYDLFNAKYKNVFFEGNFGLGKQLKKDQFWFFNFFNKYSEIEFLVNSNFQKFWEMRNLGLGYYEDSKLISSYDDFSIENESNVIFLHVFDDSPFMDINTGRIHKDYYDWFISTLKIINESTELWYIKLHPSSQRWGEDQMSIVRPLLLKYANKILRDKRLNIIPNKVANLKIIKDAKRILTFNGTIMFECVANFKKPISISYSIESILDCGIIVPKNLKDYSDALLFDIDLNITITQSENAKKILFIREELFNLGEDFSLEYLYRGDNEKIRESVFKRAIANINTNHNKIVYLASSIIQGRPCFNSKYVK